MDGTAIVTVTVNHGLHKTDKLFMHYKLIHCQSNATIKNWKNGINDVQKNMLSKNARWKS